jgi:hypothetical protein
MLCTVAAVALGIPAWQEQSRPRQALAEGPVSTTWWFPWYDSVGTSIMNTWIMIANPASTPASCNVYIGNSGNNLVLRTTPNPLTVPANTVVPYNPASLTTGPVKVECSQGVVVTERAVYYSGGFNEVTGIPQSQLTNEWWFPWFDSNGISTNVMLANPSSTTSANCSIYIGSSQGSLTLRATTTVDPSRVQALQPASLTAGPTKVVCDNAIVASQRATYNNA